MHIILNKNIVKMEKYCFLTKFLAQNKINFFFFIALFIYLMKND